MRRSSFKFESLESRDLLSINPVLLKDIAPQISDTSVVANSSDIEEFFEYDEEVYFRAYDGLHGSELWKTNGTPDGTLLVKDLNPIISSFPRQFTEANGLLFFVADTGADGREQLWRSNGTSAGTTMVKDLNFGEGAIPQGDGVMGELNDNLIFAVGNDSVDSKYDLWKTDGTVAGTSLLKDFDPGTAGGYFGVTGRMTYEFNGDIYFEAREGASGFEVWKTDGTSAGTQLMIDLNPDRFSSTPANATEVDDHLYFVADTWSEETQSLWTSLFKSDGTAAGTLQITQHGFSVSKLTPLAAHDGNVYFATDGGAFQAAPYRSDGSVEGTVRLATPGSVEDSFVLGFAPDVSGGKVAIAWVDSLFGGNLDATLWISDGSADAAFQLDGAPLGVTNGEFQLVADDGYIYYPTRTPSNQMNDRLGRSDGTPGGTVVLPEAGEGWRVVRPKSVLHDGQILMVGRIDSTGPEYWLYDPQVESYELIEIAPGGFGAIGDSDTQPFPYKDSFLVVAASSAQQGDELWMLQVETTGPKLGDINGDDAVGFTDFLILSQNFGKAVDAVLADGDLDGDGTVSFSDFLILSQNFGQ